MKVGGRRRRWTLVLATLCVALGVTALVVARRRMHARIAAAGAPTGSATSAPAPPPLTGEDEEKFLGVVVAREVVDVAPKVEGMLKEVTVNVGDIVKAGDKVADLDDRSLRRELALAQASLSGARAGEAKAAIELSDAKERNARRQKVTQDLSQEEISAAAYKEQLGGANLSAARASVAEQYARIALLTETLKNTSLRAPFAGTVAVRYHGPGEMVGPRAPIVRIIQSGDLRVRFAVPVPRSTELKPDMPVQVEIETVPAPVFGKVTSIAPEVDPSSQMIFVEAGLDPATRERLQAGLVGRVSWRRTGLSAQR